MKKWTRILYQPSLPLGNENQRLTGSQAHIALSLEAAGEGMVLLKNEQQTLPLAKGSRIALFGKGSVDYVKGGGGSGDVTTAYTRSLSDGLKIKEDEGRISLFPGLSDFYKKEMDVQYKSGAVPGMTTEPDIPDELFAASRAYTDTAVIAICRFSGEGWDRKTVIEEEGYTLFENEEAMAALSAKIFENGDFCLTGKEANLVERVTQTFSKVIVVLNTGGMIDTSWFKDNTQISSVLLAWQGGMEGGLAAANILCGDINPSGKLTDTLAASLEDYPSTGSFHESADYVDYTEDIYVGYRYFETIPGAASKVNYPFGFGLSYTDFLIEPVSVKETEHTVEIMAQVTNTGLCAGKEVVQAYYSAPQGLLKKPAKILGAFMKTRCLDIGECQTVILSISKADMASYDDLGKIAPSAWVLEKGQYGFFVGNSIRNTTELSYTLYLKEDKIIRQLSPKLVPHGLSRRMVSDGSYEELPLTDSTPAENHMLSPLDPNSLEGILPATRARNRHSFEEIIKKGAFTLEDVSNGKTDLDTFLNQLDDRMLIELLGGQPNTGAANTFGMGNLPEYGIPNVMTADGPAGLRIAPECGIYTTAWPCATLLACTFNPRLVQQVGAAAAAEVKENNIGIWLAPAVNIHRSPLCGRNFEYYSEDPLVTGKIGAALVRGIQSMHIGAAVKHFACNNKETNRKDSDSRVSERALREIYLKGFELIVKEASPWLIMSSYNKINGTWTSENRDLLTGILREEWGFDGIVTTDWWTHGEHYREILAGNDVKMGCGYPERVLEALEKGLISKEDIQSCAKRVLEMILRMD